MGRTWKELGLGLVTLAAVVIVVIGGQVAFMKRVPFLIGAPVLAALAVVIYISGAKKIERRRPTELDLHGAGRETAIGIVIGFALFTAAMAVLWATGVYHPGGFGTASRLPRELAGAASAGVLEEILFRGLLFRLSSKIAGTWGALLISALFFGAAHLSNPGATLSSSLAIVLEAGILLGAAYADTQRLWLPIGIHIGWNFTEGAVYGMSISGTGMNPGLIQGSLSGPRILTGGEFGPEASIVAVLICLAAAIYFIRRIVKLGRVESPIWQTRESRGMPA